MQDHHPPTLLTPSLIPLTGPINHPVPRQPQLKGSTVRLLGHLLRLRTRKASETLLVLIGGRAHIVDPPHDTALEADASA